MSGVRCSQRHGEGSAADAVEGLARIRSAGRVVVAETSAGLRRPVVSAQAFTQTSAAVRPRTRVTERLREQLAMAIAHEAFIVAEVKWLPEPVPTTRLGIDETRFRSVRWILDGVT